MQSVLHSSLFLIIFRYILSLALADLLVIITTVPFVSIIYTVDSWPWGESMCMISEFVKDVSIGVSVFTLTALSSDRFFAIVDPLRKFHAHGKCLIECHKMYMFKNGSSVTKTKEGFN